MRPAGANGALGDVTHHDTGDLENADDIAACELCGRRTAERASWEGDRAGEYSGDPPF
ncbi:hypothetical protein OG244_18150 [Streptomyces brevispora]|uniref:hypothetical protein n=1 Tax=Streptomyces brevispora TaxID=887462 RepID=UPI002E369C99|nr:hypothetical protein [Streptomyces brevispora]